MPELPEVEVMRRYFDAQALGREIISVQCPPKDKKVLRCGLTDAKKVLLGTRFYGSSRVGKYMFVSTEKSHWVFHFGMSGDLYFTKEDEPKPKYSRIVFSFKDGGHLHYSSLRKFGFVDLIKSKQDYVKEKSLGPDGLGIKKNKFCELFMGRKGQLKPFLMNQKNVAGLGNWIVDELLFRRKLHPGQSLEHLGNSELQNLHKDLQIILRAAIKRKTNYGNFPKNWFVPQRHAKGECPSCGSEISKGTYGGRSSYFCSACQEMFE